MSDTLSYIRVSTDKQDISPEAQKKTIELFCAASSFTIADHIIDKDVTASISFNQRPSFGKIDEYIRNGVKNIVAAKMDRMFRSTEDALAQASKWADQGVNLFLLDFNNGRAVNNQAPMEKFNFTLWSAIAELELNITRSRTKTSLDLKRSNGERLGGKIPFGYEAIDIGLPPRGRNKVVPLKLVELPHRKKIVQTILELYNIKTSIRTIAKCIRDDFNIPCSHNTVLRIIKNELKGKHNEAGALPHVG